MSVFPSSHTPTSRPPQAPRSARSRVRRAAAGVALVAGLGVVATAVPALAAQDPVLTPEQQRTLSAQVDAHRACLEQQGVTLPAEPHDDTQPRLTDEQMAAMRAAHDACESSEPDRPVLDLAQRAKLAAQVAEHRSCMATQLDQAGIAPRTRPAEADGADAPTDGHRRQRPQLTDEEKAAVTAAREACADLEPNLGVDGLGPMGRHGGPGGPGGPGRFGGMDHTGDRGAHEDAAPQTAI